jgi:hypothetical protein
MHILGLPVLLISPHLRQRAAFMQDAAMHEAPVYSLHNSEN